MNAAPIPAEAPAPAEQERDFTCWVDTADPEGLTFCGQPSAGWPWAPDDKPVDCPICVAVDRGEL
jgi:hypothetical protein